MKQVLVFEVRREGYSIDQVGNAVTVRELRDFLEDLEDDMEIILSHDNGYTYGSLSRTASIREESKGAYGPVYEEIDDAYM